MSDSTEAPEAPDAAPPDGDHGRLDAPSARRYLVHVALFAATCATTYLAQGPIFAATLMAILTCHEMGHYLAARRHGVDTSLPYFIPLPPGISLGTLGAVIRMRTPISDRNKLLDVGAAGPLAGLAVALPLLAIGLLRSHVGAVPPGSVIEGNSPLYILMKLAILGRFLPHGGIDVDLDPMAFAAWVGLLITFINLIPIGQLDGGHVASAVLGGRHEIWSRRLHGVLLVVSAIVGSAMIAIALGAGASPLAAASYATYGAVPWLIWSLLLWLMRRAGGGAYHPPVGGAALTPGRRRLALAMMVLFLLLFTPVPMRPAL
jgi:membrane-associated protease RseP (regulator of RpoE activity)